MITCIEEKNSGQFARIVIDIEPDPQHKIAKFELLAISRPAEFAIPRMSQKDTVDALGKQLERDTQTDHFSGAALVARNGNILFEQAHGASNREKKIPNARKSGELFATEMTEDAPRKHTRILAFSSWFVVGIIGSGKRANFGEGLIAE